MDNSKKDIDAIWSEIQPIIFDEFKQLFPDDKVLMHNFTAIAELAKGVQLTADNAGRELALSYLREAERDLRSCKVLRSKKIHPHAVYHLQQAVEKTTKGYVLGFGLLSGKDIYTHDTPMLFLKAVFDKTGLRSWANQSGDQDVKQLMDNAYQAISEEAKRQEIVRMSYSSIKAHLSRIDSYQSVSKQLCKNLIAEVTSTSGIGLPLSPLLQSISALPTLFILAAISFPHEEYTRYPNRDITPSDYIASLGVVRSISNMMKYLSPEIQELKEILSLGGSC